MKYGVYLEWDYTDGRAEQILNYMRMALEETEQLEFWHVWLGDYYENDTKVADEELVIAVGEQEELYPNAKIVDIMLTAKDGEITLTDVTNNKTYTGTYKMTEETSKSATYEIEIDDIEGIATITITEHFGNILTPTLSINLGGYTVYFLPNETDVE